MLRSLYLAGTGMMVQRKKMDVLTNNIANAETSGYKSDRLISRSFKDMMIERTGDPYIVRIMSEIGPQNTGVHVDEIYTDFTGGNMEETDLSTDLALQGNGYFVISTPAGECYTRDGSFTVSTEGYLMTADGNPVMGTNGRINVGTGNFAVDSQGNVTVNGTAVGQLRLVSFADQAGLRKIGNNLFINFTNQAVQPATGCTVKQGSLETSNVDIVREMVDMMQISSTYETNQRMVKMIDESLGKAVNDVGRV
jgi:flagellar basal-body rod protein FlgF